MKELDREMQGLVVQIRTIEDFNKKIKKVCNYLLFIANPYQ